MSANAIDSQGCIGRMRQLASSCMSLAGSFVMAALFLTTGSPCILAAQAKPGQRKPVAATPPAGKFVPGAVVRDSIPGTLVRFEMAYVPPRAASPGKAAIKGFLIGRTEVSWEMYDVFMHKLDSTARNPAADAIARPSMPYSVPDYGWGHNGYAANSIAYQAAEQFAIWLSKKTGHRYRLPTEAEWEYAASLGAGGRPLTRARIDSLAWHSGNAKGTTHAMGKKKADALGLYDMFGNVTEWVQSPSGKGMTRGGSFRTDPASMTPALRVPQTPEWTERDPQLPGSKWWLTDGPMVGFRLVRELQNN